MVLFYSELTGSLYLNACELIFYWSFIVIDANRGFSHTRWKLTKSTHFMRSPWVQFWNLTGNLFLDWSLYGNSLYGNDCAEKALYCSWKPGRYSELLGTCSPSQISLRHRAEHSLGELKEAWTGQCPIGRSLTSTPARFSHQHLLILLRAAPTNSFAEFSRWVKDRVKLY